MKRVASARSVSDISRKSNCTTDSLTTVISTKKVAEGSDVSARVPDIATAGDQQEVSIKTAINLTTENGQLNGAHSLSDFNQSLAMEQEITEKVAILDFGAQYGKVIDRRVRESNVYSETLPLSTSAKELVEKKFNCIIISGGPKSVYSETAPKYDPEIFNLGIPILGICYGFQVINKHFGGQVAAQPFREDGQVTVNLKTDCSLFAGLSDREKVLLTHGDSVLANTTAPDFKVIASTSHIVAGIANEAKKIYGLQFHPEVDLTENGHVIFENFLRKITGLHATYTILNREHYCIDYIRELVGDKKVLASHGFRYLLGFFKMSISYKQTHTVLASQVSGGVDSTVCAALLHRALGPERVIAIHIDNGFMRMNESKNVEKALNALGLNVKSYSCVDQFLNGRVCLDKIEIGPLKEVVDPELKLDTDIFFAQGTLRPDLIESASSLASGCADTIKTHHNDTALVRQLRNLGKVVEPLKDFHKDEVRELGRKLGLPEHIVNRHPFPGPGLAIRIICADRPFVADSFNEVAQRVSDLTDQFCEQFGIHYKVYSTLLPIRSVGVQGDNRSYSYAVALSTDHSPVPWDELDRIADYIPTVIPQVNRVCFAFGSAIKHSVRNITITKLTEGVIEKLRKADQIVTQVLNGEDADGKPIPGIESSMHLIQQMPVVLIPIQFNKLEAVNVVNGTFIHSIILRPFITRDFMTGKNAIPNRDIPEKVIQLIVNRILSEVPQLSRVLIDLTSKPPGTTEYE
ncbi:hypothetical protein M3Y97_00516300 [Aphelenchoides bicaudatus]|nr:hypothetical protein M3Y97_00516300 [Aphelenchoides bicaudatus]